jgi:primosomal protein N' (replication factor Y)
MVRSQMRDREAFGYPPFARLVVLSLKHTSYEFLSFGARRLASRLKELIGPEAVTDAHIPSVGRTAEMFFMEIMVRIEKGRSPSEVKALIREALGEFSHDKVTKRISVAVNVDPQ